MTRKVRPPLPLLFCLALGLLSGPAGLAYDLSTDESNIYVQAWVPGTIPMRILVPTSPTLSDGTTQSSSIQEAMNAWNAVVGTVQFSAQPVETAINPPANTYSNGNRRNEIAIDRTADGDAFDSNTLAVTLSYTSGDTRVEADIVFNSNDLTWDSYRGGRAGSGAHDIRRVAMHELGHVLGLNHPDEANQRVTAIMNSRISYSPAIDALQADDIAGARVLYAAPGFVPANNDFANASALTLSSGSIQATGTNVAATKETGEPNPDGNDPGGRSVWWKWTAPSSGSTDVSTFGSIFDTLLAVYTGSTVGALTRIASNDDEETISQVGNIPSRKRTSVVTFNATGGTTYFIAVDGWGPDLASAASGSITLALTFPFTANVAPAITAHPQGQTVNAGAGVTFTAAASGSPAPVLQWRRDGAIISGANGASYSISSATAGSAGTYTLVATNTAGTVTSNGAILTVNAATTPPAILTQPTGQTVAAGHIVGFQVVAIDGASYRWQESANGGVTWTNLTDTSTYGGTTTNILTISNASAGMDAFRYRVIVSNSVGSATSAAAVLSVVIPTFPSPVDVALSASGLLFVGDNSKNTIQTVSTAGVALLLAGIPGQQGSADGAAAAATFRMPGGVALDAFGNLSVADTGNSLIRKIAPDGGVSTVAGSSTNQGFRDGTGTAAWFNAPAGIALDGTGTLYVADTGNSVIRKITTAGVVTTLAGTAGTRGSADGAGAAAQFNQPAALTVDSAGNLFVADSLNHTIRRVTSAGVVSTFAGLAGVVGSADGTAASALFNNPLGITVDGSGNLYVSDSGNSTIRRISPTAVVTTLAGLPGISGLKDGNGADAWFSQPMGLRLDAGGVLYVADKGNATIRRVTANGAVTTWVITQGTVAPPAPPAPSPTPTPSPSPSGGGGGGGATEAWFAVIGLVILLRRLREAQAS